MGFNFRTGRRQKKRPVSRVYCCAFQHPFDTHNILTELPLLIFTFPHDYLYPVSPLGTLSWGLMVMEAQGWPGILESPRACGGKALRSLCGSEQTRRTKYVQYHAFVLLHYSITGCLKSWNQDAEEDQSNRSVIRFTLLTPKYKSWVFLGCVRRLSLLSSRKIHPVSLLPNSRCGDGPILRKAEDHQQCLQKGESFSFAWEAVGSRRPGRKKKYRERRGLGVWLGAYCANMGTGMWSLAFPYSTGMKGTSVSPEPERSGNGRIPGAHRLAGVINSIRSRINERPCLKI